MWDRNLTSYSAQILPGEPFFKAYDSTIDQYQFGLLYMPAGRKDLPPLQATWHAALGILVSGESLPLPRDNRTLQLWLIPKAAGSKPIPSLTVRPDADGKFHLLVQNPPESQGDTKALAITEEPAGGSPQPTTTPVWVGAVTGK